MAASVLFKFLFYLLFSFALSMKSLAEFLDARSAMPRIKQCFLS